MKPVACRICASCRQVLPLDPHLPDCPEMRERDLAPPKWRVLRIARDAEGKKLEELLEACNRRAAAWLEQMGRTL